MVFSLLEECFEELTKRDGDLLHRAIEAIAAEPRPRAFDVVRHRDSVTGVGSALYRLSKDDETAIEFGEVRVDLAHVHPSAQELIIREARARLAQGQRLPILTIKDDGVDVSERPDL